jgi:hypothetical protein
MPIGCIASYPISEVGGLVPPCSESPDLAGFTVNLVSNLRIDTRSVRLKALSDNLLNPNKRLR